MSSEIARGLDVAELAPSEFVTQNEIDAAKTVHLDYLNAQGQPKFAWPPSFALARAYVDQLERTKCLSARASAPCGRALANAEQASGSQRREALTQMVSQLEGEARGSCDAPKVGTLAAAVRDLATVVP